MSVPDPLRPLTVSEVAELFRRNPQTIYDEIRRVGAVAGVKPVRIGRTILFPRPAIEAVLRGDPILEEEPVHAAS